MTSVVDNKNAATLFLATNAGVYYSTDDGQNWHAANAGLPANVVATSILSEDMNLLIGTAHKGLYYSADAGKTWLSAGELPLSGKISYLAVSGGYVYASSPAGLYKLSAQDLGF